MCHSQSIDRLLELSLLELLTVESAFPEALARMLHTATCPDLKAELIAARETSREHVATLENAADTLEIDFRASVTSNADLWTDEIGQLAGRNLAPAVTDIGLVHLCRRIESRRASGYRAAMDLATAAGAFRVHDGLKAGEVKCVEADWKFSTFADTLLSGLNLIPVPDVAMEVPASVHHDTEVEILDEPVMMGLGNLSLPADPMDTPARSTRRGGKRGSGTRGLPERAA